MTFVSVTQFYIYTYRGVNACLAKCLNSVLNVKAVVGAFNQEKALVGAFSVIVQLHRLIVYITNPGGGGGGVRGCLLLRLLPRARLLPVRGRRG